MIITITAPGEYMADTQDEPEVGRRYQLEDATSGTGAQNRAFHALLWEYYKTRLWSYQGSGYNSGVTFDEFRNMIKRKLGAGFESFVYAEIVDGRPVIRDAKAYAEIPETVRRDPHLKELVRGRLKSWADYTKRERRTTMDALITEMIEVGVNTPHFREIMEGMEATFK
ncbi:MAG TPA: hypothetical protein PKW66_28810 [Polyangiaceae bacterium]|nr:hypothetical protein [Polyangiaceae bacterium]